jgi:uncharacterized membrane protein
VSSTPRWHEWAWVRLAGYSLCGGLAALYPQKSVWIRGLDGWVVASTVALAYQVWQILRTNPEKTRRRASLEDPGRTIVWLVILAGCAFSLAASLVLMGQKDDSPQRMLTVCACLWAVLSSWFLTHTSFTLRYAHLFYREQGKEGGLEFPGGEAPDDWDFAYFSFTLGMCFQTSDVGISDRSIRRTALLHSLLSFFYNTAILALTFNLIMNHLGTLFQSK